MKIIIFQKFNFNYIFFLLYLLACLISSGIDICTDNNQYDAQDATSNYKTNTTNITNLNINYRSYAKTTNETKANLFGLINIFAKTISDFLAIIPYLIKKKRSKGINKNNLLLTNTPNESGRNSSTTTNSFIYNNLFEDEINKKSKYSNSYSFIVSLLDFFSEIILYLYEVFKGNFEEKYNGFNLLNCTVIFQIIVQYISSKIILKDQFYRHHYLSLIINTISFIILFILDVKHTSEFDLYLIIYFFSCLFLVLENTYGKKAMISGYISPYTLLIFKGIYKLLILIVFSIIFLPIIYKTYDESFFKGIYTNLNFSIIFVILNAIFPFFKDLFNWILIDKFSPSHLALSLILEDISYLIIFAFINPKSYKIENDSIAIFDVFARIFIYIILFIAAMIHNEIFIITKCGLGDNTKLFLDEKVKEEMMLSNLEGENFEILKRYDTMIEMEMNTNNEENENNIDANNEEENNIITNKEEEEENNDSNEDN